MNKPNMKQIRETLELIRGLHDDLRQLVNDLADLLPPEIASIQVDTIYRVGLVNVLMAINETERLMESLSGGESQA